MQTKIYAEPSSSAGTDTFSEERGEDPGKAGEGVAVVVGGGVQSSAFVTSKYPL